MSTTPQIKPNKYVLEFRDITMVATPGSQRRVYDGCPHPKDWEFMWGPWRQLYRIGAEDVASSLESYRAINKEAVRARGDAAKSEFRAVDVETGECYER